ncbi:MAG: 16S rRNA (adenine(1518)-N(6)/adenine(1519)-N(6))-dimethyltransferase RsmA [Armatimonas sp.]
MDLTRPSELKPFLERHGFALQKRFGQNFLISRVHLEKIVGAAEIAKSDHVLEIGPGAGVLTVELAKQAGKVTSIELDRALIPLLDDVMTEFDNFTLLQGDALQLPLPEANKVVANIPYNITSPLLVRLLSHRPAFDSLTLLVQKEVAQRLVAAPGTSDYGALTVFVNYYASARIAVSVPKGVFLPPPKIDSAAIHLTVHSVPPVEVPSEEALFAVSRAAFGQRRKTIANALSAGLERTREDVESALNQCGIDPEGAVRHLRYRTLRL